MRSITEFFDRSIPGQSADELRRLISEDRRLGLRLGMDGSTLRDVGLDRRSS
jgi:hypothetical protein